MIARGSIALLAASALAGCAFSKEMDAAEKLRGKTADIELRARAIEADVARLEMALGELERFRQYDEDQRTRMERALARQWGGDAASMRALAKELPDALAPALESAQSRGASFTEEQRFIDAVAWRDLVRAEGVLAAWNHPEPSGAPPAARGGSCGAHTKVECVPNAGAEDTFRCSGESFSSTVHIEDGFLVLTSAP